MSSDPPEWGVDLATPFGEDGSFDATLVLDPKIDGTVDCTTVTCSVVVRGDDESGGDRSQELALPVAFDGEPRSEDTASTTSTPESPDVEMAVDADDEDGGAPIGLIVGLAVAALVAAGLAFAKVRSGTDPSGDESAPRSQP